MLLMKHNKGERPYLRELKKREIILASFQWGAVVAFLLIGFLTTGTTLNLFTVFGLLSCLPAAKTLVGIIVKFSYKPMSDEICDRIERESSHLATIFHPILTSSEKIVRLDCLVISNQNICGYCSYESTDLEYAKNYIRLLLTQHNIEGMNIKIFHDFNAFISRVEGLNNMEKIDGAKSADRKETIKQILIPYSM